jgi:hypothetical protein
MHRTDLGVHQRLPPVDTVAVMLGFGNERVGDRPAHHNEMLLNQTAAGHLIDNVLIGGGQQLRHVIDSQARGDPGVVRVRSNGTTRVNTCSRAGRRFAGP